MWFTSHAAIVKPNAENWLKNEFQPNFRFRRYHRCRIKKVAALPAITQRVYTE